MKKLVFVVMAIFMVFCVACGTAQAQKIHGTINAQPSAERTSGANYTDKIDYTDPVYIGDCISMSQLGTGAVAAGYNPVDSLLLAIQTSVVLLAPDSNVTITVTPYVTTSPFIPTTWNVEDSTAVASLFVKAAGAAKALVKKGNFKVENQLVLTGTAADSIAYDYLFYKIQMDTLTNALSPLSLRGKVKIDYSCFQIKSTNVIE